MRILVACLFALLFVDNGAAQQIQFDRLELVKGLQNRSITSIIHDDFGFMWFGSADGLVRYDGYDTKIYKTNRRDKNSIGDNNIRALAKDKDGNIWIATQGGGLDKFDIRTEKFTHFVNKVNDVTSISGNAVWSVFVDSKGFIWAGTFSNGLNRIDPEDGKITRIVERNYLPVLAITEDADGYIWFSSNGITRVDPKDLTLKHYYAQPKDPQSLASGGIRSILQDGDKHIWVGAVDGGLFRFQPEETRNFVRHGVSDATGFQSIYALHADGNGAIWVGGNGGIALAKKDGSMEIIGHNPTDKYSLSTNAIRAIYRDAKNMIWVGTEGGGVNRVLAKKKFEVFRADGKPGSVSYNVIRCIYEDRSGSIWVGTQGGGLNVLDTGTNAFVKVNIPANELSSVYEDSDGSFWIGSWGQGLFHYNESTGSLKNYRRDAGAASSLPDDRIQVVHRDHKGQLWVGTENGLAQFYEDEQRWVPFTKPYFPQELLASNIQGQAFVEAPDGSIWLGTWFGLNRISADRQTVINYTTDTTSSYLSSEHVISLHLNARKNLLWIGTFGGGLNMLDIATNSIIHFTEEDGLPNNTIYGIKEDNDGFLWLSTNNGLSRFNPETRAFRNYDATEGLQGNEFYWGAAGRTRDGKMFFGGVNGLTAFNPSEIKDNTDVPPLVITSFELFNKPVAIQPGSVLESNINNVDKLTLNHEQDVLTFQFSALNYQSPEKNLYAYYLENFDDDWNYVGNKRSVSYTNLSPGEYVLRIKGSNNDGIWNEKGIAVPIVIVPPFWQTWWFYTFTVLFVVSALYGFLKIRLNSVRRDRETVRRTMQEALDNAHQQIEREKRAVIDEQNKNAERNWIDQSLSIVSDILSKSKDDVNELCSHVLSALIKRCEVVAGAIYLFDESTDELKRTASFGFMQGRESVPVDSGQIGECYRLRETISIDNLPEGFCIVGSGLGEAVPHALILVPLQYEEHCVGVMELASFTMIPEYRRQFIETLSAQLTATIHTTQISQRTRQLLDESRIQTEDLKVREEELKQNLEEMQAIQEEYDRKTREYERMIEQLQQKVNPGLA